MRFIRPGKTLAWSLIILLLAASGAAYAYNIKVYQGSDSVFWDSLSADLSQPGVTCTIDSKNNGLTSKQAVSLNLVDGQTARMKTTLAQNGYQVTTDDISTKDANYIRYTDFSGHTKGLDTSKVLNVWAKQSLAISGDEPVLNKTALGGCIVPLVNVAATKQTQLISELKAGKVFQTNLQKSTWHWSLDEPYREYDVTVDPVAYVTFMKHVGDTAGIKSLDSLSPDKYKDKKPEQLTFRIGAASHRIEKISYKDKKQSFSFSNYGSVPNTTIPEHSIAMSELQKRLQNLGKQNG